jgi:hypothetical protein
MTTASCQETLYHALKEVGRIPACDYPEGMQSLREGLYWVQMAADGSVLWRYSRCSQPLEPNYTDV